MFNIQFSTKLGHGFRDTEYFVKRKEHKNLNYYRKNINPLPLDRVNAIWYHMLVKRFTYIGKPIEM